MNSLSWMYNRNHTTLLNSIVGILVLVFFANCFTPLRLHVDTIRYFVIKDCIEFGCLPDSIGALDYLPIGYTSLLIGLSKMGILNSFMIVFFNCIFLFISIYLVIKIFNKSINIYFFIILVLVNWTIIKFVIHPLSEMQYLFFSCSSLYLFNKFAKTRKIWPLLGSFLLAGFSFLTRTVGVTLVIALVMAFAWEFRKELLAFVKSNRAILPLLLLVVILVVVFSKQLGLNHYLQVFSKQFDEGVAFNNVLRWHFIEWTEIFLNTPFTKIVGYSPSVIRYIFLIGGIAIFITMLYLIYIGKNRIPFVISIYLIFYFILMFNWPFYDPRFWVPVLPIFLAIIAQHSIFSLSNKILRLTLVAIFIWYSFIGVISIGYFTVTSFDHDLLAKTQASGVYKREYEILFHEYRQSDINFNGSDSVIVNLLKRYR